MANKTANINTARDVDMLEAVIEAYYIAHPTGGSLHVVLDDGNWNRSSLTFCLNEAKNNNDAVGEAIAIMLLEAPDNIVEECNTLDSIAGMASWRHMLHKQNSKQ